MDKINEIFGEVSPGFERVRMEFQNNFKDRKELGAACTIYYQAGLVLLDEKLSIEQLKDFDQTAKILIRAKPLWEPGKYQGYQAGTVGFFMGELVRRVDPKA